MVLTPPVLTGRPAGAWQDEQVTNAASAGSPRRTAGRCPAVTSLAAGALLALTGCTASPTLTPEETSTVTGPQVEATGGAEAPEQSEQSDQSDQPEQSDQSDQPEAAAPVPTASEPPPEGIDDEKIARAVESALEALAGSRDAVTSDQVRAAIGAGFTDADAVAESIEVSIDRTPTGLDVDAIQGAGLVDGTCIFGEVREGTVSVAVLPALATGLCFVGDQR